MTPPDSSPLGTRAGDREREATAGLLGHALTQGYLDMTEYEDRVRAAFGAHTTAELKTLVSDLPVSQLRHSDPRRREARRAAARLSVRLHLTAYLLMVVVVVVIWLAVGLSVGSWYFWPIWPVLGAGIGVVAHTIPVRLTTR